MSLPTAIIAGLAASATLGVGAVTVIDDSSASGSADATVAIEADFDSQQTIDEVTQSLQAEAHRVEQAANDAEDDVQAELDAEAAAAAEMEATTEGTVADAAVEASATAEAVTSAQNDVESAVSEVQAHRDEAAQRVDETVRRTRTAVRPGIHAQGQAAINVGIGR